MFGNTSDWWCTCRIGRCQWDSSSNPGNINPFLSRLASLLILGFILVTLWTWKDVPCGLYSERWRIRQWMAPDSPMSSDEFIRDEQWICQWAVVVAVVVKSCGEKWWWHRGLISNLSCWTDWWMNFFRWHDGWNILLLRIIVWLWYFVLAVCMG